MSISNYSSKYEFLAALDKELERFGIVDKDDVLVDFEQHFNGSKKQGLTDAEVCEKLGSVTEIAKQYASDAAGYQEKAEKTEEAQASEAAPVQENTAENEDGSLNFIKDFTDKINDIRVSVVVAKTTIVASPDNITRVRYNNNRPGMRFSAEMVGSVLEISEKSRGFSFWLFGFTGHHSDLLIELPKKLYESFNFGTVSGGAEISGFSAKHLVINSTSGTVNVKSHAEEIDISTISGNMSFENSLGLRTKSLKVNSTSGHANIYGVKPQNYTISAISGHLDIAGLTGDGKINLTSGHAKIRFDEFEAPLNISVVSGWIDVTLPEDAGINLNLSKVSGYVKYDFENDAGRCNKNGQYGFGGAKRQNANISLTSGHVNFAGPTNA